MRTPMLVALSILLLPGCTSSKSGDTVSVGGAPAREPFCAAWTEAVAGADDSRLLVVLEDPPDELAEPAAAIIAAHKAGDSGSGQAGGAAEVVSQWVELNCNPTVAVAGGTASERRLAPPRGATPDTLTLCSAASAPPKATESTGGVVLYGRGSDPYSAPMIGVVWGEGDHSGDGDSTPVRVRGTEGVAAPITVFQQVVLEKLGTVIAWNEDGRSVGLYGRHWSLDRADELVSIAEQLEFTDGSYHLPEAALPTGLRQIFVGKPGGLSLILGAAGYELHYESAGGVGTPATDNSDPEVPVDSGGVVTLSGFVASPEEYETLRFFAPGLTHVELGKRQAIVGNAWSDEGPAVVTWREPDGLVVRLVGLGVELETLRDMAGATRELTRPEWVELVKGSDDCS